jgi:hypothetical protein
MQNLEECNFVCFHGMSLKLKDEKSASSSLIPTFPIMWKTL